MPTVLVASLQPGEGRTTAAAGIGALLAEGGRSVRLLRLRVGAGSDPAAEDDAQALAAVPGCDSPGHAVTEQDAFAQGAATDAFTITEAPPGVAAELAARLAARVVLVSAEAGDLRIGDLASAAGALKDVLLGVVILRQPEARLDAVGSALRARGLTPLALVPEDRLLAGPTVHEMAEALHASRLFEGGDEREAVQFVMIGPITADPGQPYFLQHAGKAVVNRFDKMDLHLAALATEPDCVILTGGQMPSPYFLDRLRGSDTAVTVLLSPEGTVRTAELLDDLYTRTRFAGLRKIDRAVELFRHHLDTAALKTGLS